MKNSVLLMICFLIGNAVFTQKRATHTGEIYMEASVPLFEEIKAVNNSVSCVFDESNGKLSTLAVVKAFRFKLPLMEEHFNKNYLESSRFSKSTFKGKIVNFDVSKLSSIKKEYDLEGNLTLHGVTKRIKTKITLFLDAGFVYASSNFEVLSKDYKVEIPSILQNKISEKVVIEVNFKLEKK